MSSSPLPALALLFLDGGPADRTLDDHAARLAAIEAVPVEEDVVPSSRAPRVLPGQLYALAMAVADLPTGGAGDHEAVVEAAARILRAHAARLARPDRADWIRAEQLLAWQALVFRAPKIPGLNALLERAHDALLAFLRHERLA